ncbi:MAG: M36 family metallopeptidase, partial [Casimicrobium sp.]
MTKQQIEAGVRLWCQCLQVWSKRFHFGNPPSPALHGSVVAVLAAALSMAGAVSARDLTRIDRLGDAVPARGAALSGLASAAPSEAVRMHSRLQVPTFLWGNSGSPAAASIAAITTSVPRDAAEAARAYLQGLDSLYKLRAGQLDALAPAATHNFANGAVLVKLRNRLDGVEVFREEAAVLLSPDRKLVAIGGFLMGGYAAGAFDRSAAEAATVALSDWSFAGHLAPKLRVVDTRDGHEYLELPPGLDSSPDGSRLDAPLRVQPVYFRMPDHLIPAYYIEVQMRDGMRQGAVDYYAYVIAATDLSVLYRQSQTADAAFSYRVFAESGGNNLPYPSPVGRNGFPSPTGIPDGYQPPFVSPNLVTLQNLPFSRNDPWLAPGATQTNGNNVNAFANLVLPDGFGPVDPAECNVGVPPTVGDFHACTNAANTFDYTHDPAEAPKASKTQVMAAVTNLFYLTNWLHDWYYDAGFDEKWGNAQASNFGRGGREEDALIAQAQDASGTNNADMYTPSDGGSPRMRMYVYEYRFPMVKVLAPAAIAGIKASAVARFGAQAFDVTANVVSSVPSGACSTLTNAAALTGRIALIDLDGGTACDATTKVKNAQNAGAAGVLLADKLSPFVGTVRGVDATISIPSLAIGSTDTLAITSQPDDTVSARLARAAGVDRDGTMANEIIAHEWGHYISNRLIANASGMSTNQAQGLGEGWADFHAMLLLVKGTDSALPNNASFNGTYAHGGYPDGGPGLAPDLYNTAFYHGQRRYPYSRDLAKNPLTFRLIQDGVALPAAPVPFLIGGDNSEVHNTGEVWASMLWQCYSNLLNDTSRLTFAHAQDRMKNYLVAGYKMTPANPTFIEARDALLSVISVQSSEDHALCMQGFAARGAGVGAVGPDRYSTTNAGVIESFGAIHINSVVLSDQPQYCDGDGIVDNGETGFLTITLQNTGATALSATTGSVVSSNAHIQFPSGAALTIPASMPGQQMSLSVPVTVVGAAGREATDFTITIDNPGLPGAPLPVTANFLINVDQLAAQSAIDDVESAHTLWRPDFAGLGPGQWQRLQISPGDHRWASSDPPAVSDEWLVSPPLYVAATGSFSFTFRHRNNFKYRGSKYYGGGILMISTDGTNFSEIPVAALTPPYNGTIDDSGDNPRRNLPAYVGTNASYPSQDTVTVNLGAAYQGQTVYIGFVSATDFFKVKGTFTGWEIDDIAFSNITNKPFDLTTADAGACVRVAPVAGTPQSAPVGSAFATPLQ